MITLLAALLLSQSSPVTLQNPTNPTKRVTTTTSGPKELLDVNVAATSASGQTWVTIDGGYVAIWDSNGDVLDITAAGAAKVDGSGVTQPVSAASLPLPTGAATAARQDTGNTSLSSIDSKTPALVSGRQPVDGSGVTQPISAASLPLPTGAATAANQTGIGNQTTKINDGTDTASVTAAGRLEVDPWI